MLLGVALVVGGSFLTWWRLSGVSLSAWKIPISYLVNGGSGGGPKAGPFLLVVVVALVPLAIGRKLPSPLILFLSWVPLAFGLCAFIRGLRASPSLHPDIGMIMTFGGGALMAADALDVGIPQTKGLILTLATAAVVILATSGGAASGTGISGSLPPSFEMSALPVPHVSGPGATSAAASNTAQSGSGSGSSTTVSTGTTSPASGGAGAGGTGSGQGHTSTTIAKGATTSTTGAVPLTCWYPDSIHVSGGSPTSLSGQGGEFTVESTPVVVSTDTLPNCTSQYEISVIGAHGMGHDCESSSFHYDVSDIVQPGDLVSVSFELPPNDCGGGSSGGTGG